jgi:hypothetical protein
MLPVVAGTVETTRQIVGYTFIMVGFSLALGLVAEAGVLYMIVAIILGLRFAQLALQLHTVGLCPPRGRRRGGPRPSDEGVPVLHRLPGAAAVRPRSGRLHLTARC